MNIFTLKFFINYLITLSIRFFSIISVNSSDSLRSILFATRMTGTLLLTY